MHRQVFSNRWIAIFFVLLVAAGAASLVGTEDSEGAIDRATQQITSQNAEFERSTAELSQPKHSVIDASENDVGEASMAEFASDEELVDTAEGSEASGFDPSPEEPDSFESFDSGPDDGPGRRLAGPDGGVMLSLDDEG